MSAVQLVIRIYLKIETERTSQGRMRFTFLPFYLFTFLPFYLFTFFSFNNQFIVSLELCSKSDDYGGCNNASRSIQQ